MKQCFKCQRDLPLSEFYKHKQMKDGRLNKCKSCAKSDSTKNRGKNLDRIREYDRARGSRQRDGYLKEYRDKYPNKYKAHLIVGNAIRDKKLFRMSCESCGTDDNPNAHHDDYSKPLNVRWLCSACHHQWHAKNGEGKNAA